MADKHRDASTFERTLTLAWTQAQVQLRHLGIEPDEAHLFQRLANAIIYADAALRPSSDAPQPRRHSMSARCGRKGFRATGRSCWRSSVKSDDIDIVRQLLRAHEYWRMKQLAADLVIVNEKPHSYEQDLQDSLEALVRGSQFRVSPERGDALGNIFLLRGGFDFAASAHACCEAVARAVLFSRRGTLSDQVNRSQRPGRLVPAAPVLAACAGKEAPIAPAKPPLRSRILPTGSEGSTKMAANMSSSSAKACALLSRGST